ncbi:serine/threonine dehydratase [Streptomonospora nanhaiensis]|uniref:Threonine dehydratase n=1 Tax=Streptomonospora nanhaiensis TaxID=1323731 RepID=A0A853BFB9_9ACTN|nr:serine/threonine dehydratase [Streptomonospora nanhaiensis]MBV2364592.1 serine/threonine dehydratase [Streptomonospora nanhaiensis]MBX9387514.1 serine/threonine dehydratase [Streptomonospora nanhaiensis]NYI94148.1 threonine dehydratase [Streptomonospora nanhaiensis]
MSTPSAATAALPTPADVAVAARRIAPYARRTPVLSATVDGRPLSLKLEHLQATGAFKLRGALNALLAAGRPERVVTASGGNHGLGVATAARMLGLAALVYVPETVPEVKARRLEESGAELVRVGAHYAEAAEAAVARAQSEGLRYLHAYDDPDVVAGQGTIGAEIAQDAPQCDGVAVAVGGGGLVAGVRLGAGDRVVTAVEPEGCRSMHAALAAGEPVVAPVDSVASSALGAARMGDVPFAVLRHNPVATALVTDAEIVAARDRLWEEFRIAAEPAAAVPFAAWLAGRVAGEHVCLVICGANADWTPGR